ncbi:hypothetical protein M378DRAFT_65148 [Amanita muscaria Koide BX008]|uniref:Protein MON2 homolog n=1 Tax=Amanita muscaria (strain Koide BX008) TaxID=946122 RepID=A0A0C2TVS8_AMAMK|nr:hypothetical protein M378DRAFT_65148 [Amanita muscaria Koide BX008]
MSSLAFLVTELQSLASETRRKHPEIREAAEKSLAILRASPEQATAKLASDGPQSDDLLRPVFMGCATKNAKVVAISLGSLQRLIALKAVPQSAVRLIVNTMSDAMSQGVDIQLRILQTLVSLTMNFPAIHGDLLGDALLLCFKLQESKIVVVSSTAAATLRQLVMSVVEKMVIEDRREDINEDDMTEVQLPDETRKKLGLSSRDAYFVLEDLCLLANSERPRFLKLESLQKTFTLELIESVLTNYYDLFRKRPELMLLLRHHLSPLLLKALSERPIFPLTLRCTRVVFLLLKQFSFELHTEAEVFFMLMIKLITEEQESSDHSGKPLWVRVLAMEIIRGLCNDAELIRNMWARYDARDNGSKVFTALVTALKRLVTEKPALLGVSTQTGGIGVVPDVMGAGHGLDVSTVAGRVATAATATVSGVVGMMGPAAGLSVQGSSMKLQCIDQLDKADSPPIPETYIYLLAVQAITSLCEGFSAFTAPFYTSIVIQRPRAPGDAATRAPPALDLSSLPADDISTKHLKTVRDIIESGWPALLAALSFIIGTNLSEELFVEVLSSYKAMTSVSGMLGLTTPRDAFFTSLAKLAVPSRVVSSLDSYSDPQTPRTTVSITENLGLAAPPQPPGLSERNMACLKVFLSSALFLAGSLGESWYQILEALQNADYVLTFKGMHSTPGRRTTLSPTTSMPPSRSMSISSNASQTSITSTPPQHPRHILMSDLDPETLQNLIQRLFDVSRNLEDLAFKDFVNALCRLSFEMISMQSEFGGSIPENESVEEFPSSSSVMLTPKKDPAHRRRVSGIFVPKTLRTGDFGLTKLVGVAMLNIHRLIYRSPDIAWYSITTHLLSVIRLSSAPQAIRLQAARVLDDILLNVPRNLTTAGELQAQVQQRALDVLAQQVVTETTISAATPSTNIELRRMGLETLHQILQSSGHTLLVGWETIFHMLESVCKPAAPRRTTSSDSVSVPPSPIARLKPLPGSLGLGLPTEKGYTALVKIAFLSLTVVCDSVTSLSPEHLRLCISTLGQFGRQADTNIALTAAASLLWSVSDAIQAKRKNAEQEPLYSELWMFLLLEELGLCTDARPEVRDGAIQTLFRALQLYGSTLNSDLWDQIIWKVTFPLLDALTAEIRQRTATTDVATHSAWDESKVLALQSIGALFHEFLVSDIIHLDSFSNAWETFVNHVQDSVLSDNRFTSAPALRCLEKGIKASAATEGELRNRVDSSLEIVWGAIDTLGSAILHPADKSSSEMSPYSPFTQESLVAFIDVIQCTRSVNRSIKGEEWQLDRVSRLMAILKGVLTYSHSPDYRHDIDALSPVQSVVIDTVLGIDLSTLQITSLVVQDLSEYATLPFLASFELDGQDSRTAPKQITYIALSKKTMPLLVELYLRFKDKLGLYMDGTVEALVAAYSIPIKMKYDCPPPSKHGNDLPLWKTATNCFLQIVKECAIQMKQFDEDISDERIEGIWRQILDVFRGGILADCSPVEFFQLEKQDEEETFDLSLISALEIDVVPFLGDSRVPDHLVSQLGNILHHGSLLHQSTDDRPPVNGYAPDTNSHQEIRKAKKTKKHEEGTTETSTVVPRERFSYWCFDLLFLVCSNTTKESELSRRRLASLTLLSLLNRCRKTLVEYVADESLRGHIPFPRVREEELLYVLRKLSELRLWPGSLWAALSDDPTKYAAGPPSIADAIAGEDKIPSQLIADAVKRSSIAHLFHFYSVLTEIASKHRPLPAMSISALNGAMSQSPRLDTHTSDKTTTDDSIHDLDARLLARTCLWEIGKEMGVVQ